MKYYLAIPFAIILLWAMGLFSELVLATPAIEASSTAGSLGAPATSLTFAINVPAGLTNSSLFVFANRDNGCTGAASITYNGSNMSAGGAGTGNGGYGHYWAYTNNPTSGNNNVVVTPGCNSLIWATAMVVSAADVSGNPVSASSTAAASSAAIQTSLNTTLNELLIDNLRFSNVITGAGTGQTSFSYLSGVADGQKSTMGTQKTATSTGNASMSETISGSTGWSNFTLSIMSAAVPASPILNSQTIFFE